jgi:hypothetical protein
MLAGEAMKETLKQWGIDSGSINYQETVQS